MKTNASSHIISVPAAAIDATEYCWRAAGYHMDTSTPVKGCWQIGHHAEKKRNEGNEDLNYNQKCSRGEQEENNLPRLPLQGLPKSSTYIRDGPDVAAAREWDCRSVVVS